MMKRICLLAVAWMGLTAAPASAFYDFKSTSYSWVSAPSMNSKLSNCDDCVTTVNLGFTFPFYGRDYTQVSISSNGFLVLGGYTGGAHYTNRSINELGSNSVPGPTIAPFWDDLNPSASSNSRIYTGKVGNAFVIEWRNVAPYGDKGDTFTFEAKLFKDGNIEFHYKDVNHRDSRFHRGRSATVGFQEDSNTVGQPRCNNHYGCAENSTAFGWKHPGKYAFYSKAWEDYSTPRKLRGRLKTTELVKCREWTQWRKFTTQSYRRNLARAAIRSCTVTDWKRSPEIADADPRYSVAQAPMSSKSAILHGRYNFITHSGVTPAQQYPSARFKPWYSGSATSKLDYFPGPNGGTKGTILLVSGFDPLEEDTTASFLADMGDFAKEIFKRGYGIAIGKVGQGNRRLSYFSDEVGLWAEYADARFPGNIQVAGVSMGGVILRDALGRNSHGINQHISAWYSVDAPQRGANMGSGNQGLQNLLLCNSKGSPQYNKVFSNPAADMMMRRVTGCKCSEEPENSTCSSSSSMSDDYYGGLKWPKTSGVRRYALAFGDGNPSGGFQTQGGGYLYWFSYSADTCSADDQWRGTQRDCAAGSKYIRSSDVNTRKWTGWCENFRLKLVWDPAFISVDSALGLKKSGVDINKIDTTCNNHSYGDSVANSYWTAWGSNNSNVDHKELTPSLAAKLLTWIAAND